MVVNIPEKNVIKELLEKFQSITWDICTHFPDRTCSMCPLHSIEDRCTRSDSITKFQNLLK
jgi:hypothetical protein